MARPIRLQFPGALFHITCRGNAKQTIFHDDADRRFFLRLLGRCVTRFGWILPAYVLMGNHFHLVVQLTTETLSRGLHWLNGEYARYFNNRHGRVGHLLQGRPHTPLIDEQTYYLEVLRYVVLNPVRAQIVPTPEQYEWSSHRAVIGAVAAPAWLAVDDALAHFAPDRDIARARYRCFVDAGIRVERSPWADLVGQIYLGSDPWIDKIRDRVRLKPRADDHPRAQRMVGTPGMAEIVSAVARTLSTTDECVRSSRGLPRMVAAWIAWNEALLNGREIAAGLRLAPPTVSRLLRACDGDIDRNPTLKQLIDQSISTLRRKTATVKA